MKKLMVSLMVLGSVAAFADGGNSENGSLYEQYNTQAVRPAVCTGVKIISIGTNDDVQTVYDLSQAVCQPGKIWTAEELAAQQGGSSN